MSFFLRDVLGEIWDLIGSVFEGFLTYFYRKKFMLNLEFIFPRNLTLSGIHSLRKVSEYIPSFPAFIH